MDEALITRLVLIAAGGVAAWSGFHLRRMSVKLDQLTERVLEKGATRDDVAKMHERIDEVYDGPIHNLRGKVHAIDMRVVAVETRLQIKQTSERAE